MNAYKKLFCAAAILWAAAALGKSVNFGMLGFESPEVLSTLRAEQSSAALSPRHRIGGERSLQWTFEPEGTLAIDFAPWFLTDAEATELYGAEARSILTLNVYAQQPLPGKTLRVGFGRRGVPEDDCWFEMNLDFSGWRHLWPVYSRDMQGTPHKGMNEIRLRAPAGAAGTLYFDDLIPGSLTYERYQERDRTAAFIRPLPRDPLSLDTLRPQPDGALSPAESAAFRSAENRLESLIFPEASRKALREGGRSRALKSVRNFMASSQIRRHEDGRITGRPILYGVLRRQYGYVPESKALLEEFLPLRSLGSIAQLTARLYLETEDEALRRELADSYLLLIDHLADQGYTDGSSMGSRAILGYSTRELYNSFFLMRRLLADTGRLDAVQKTGFWQQTVNACLLPDGHESINADYFNIEARGALISILLMPDEPEKAAYLRRFGEFISRGLHPTPGAKPFIKPDGCVFHHWGHYPSYAFGGLTGATQIRSVFCGTPWALDGRADRALAGALRSAWIYSNPYVAMGLEGRVPFRRLHNAPIRDCIELYARDGDEQMAELLRKETQDGHWSFNYGGFGIHRSGGKAVTLKGFNRFVWGSEIYQDYNRFGRYLSYGSIYILGSGTPDEEGRSPDGWDWNRIPGVTSIHRPWEELDTPSRGHEMRILPDNRINGSSNLNGRYGLFGMIITEPDREHYDPQFHAVKSVFAFGDMLIALGSDIRSSEPGNPVETTLYQYHLGPDGSRPGYFNRPEALTAVPASESLAAPAWSADFKRNAYFVLDGGTVRLDRRRQTSPSHRTKEMTEGPVASCVIDHGPAPDDAGYEFVVKLDMAPEDAPAFARRLAENKPYTVLSRHAGCHAVRETSSGVTALVAFAPQTKLEWGPLLGVNTPGYVMFREEKDVLELSLTIPDLAGFRRDDSSANDIEPMRFTETEDVDRPVTVRLKGRWRLAAGEADLSHPDPQTTRLTALFRDGIPAQLKLAREPRP